jgi:microcystin-dependent protein
MSSPFVAEIRIFGFNFAPVGWALCNGQLLPISQNTALFSLLGTTYGGNGTSTFGLPNLQGCAPLDAGQGPGLSDRVLGETGGQTTVTLSSNHLPIHAHSNAAFTSAGNQNSPVNNACATAKVQRQTANLYSSTDGATMNAGALAATGGGQPHNNMPPYLVLNFCIAMQGVFPSRN